MTVSGHVQPRGLDYPSVVIPAPLIPPLLPPLPPPLQLLRYIFADPAAARAPCAVGTVALYDHYADVAPAHTVSEGWTWHSWCRCLMGMPMPMCRPGRTRCQPQSDENETSLVR